MADRPLLVLLLLLAGVLGCLVWIPGKLGVLAASLLVATLLLCGVVAQGLAAEPRPDEDARERALRTFRDRVASSQDNDPTLFRAPPIAPPETPTHDGLAYEGPAGDAPILLTGPALVHGDRRIPWAHIDAAGVVLDGALRLELLVQGQRTTLWLVRTHTWPAIGPLLWMAQRIRAETERRRDQPIGDAADVPRALRELQTGREA